MLLEGCSDVSVHPRKSSELGSSQRMTSPEHHSDNESVRWSFSISRKLVLRHVLRGSGGAGGGDGGENKNKLEKRKTRSTFTPISMVPYRK